MALITQLVKSKRILKDNNRVSFVVQLIPSHIRSKKWAMRK
jgi:hypothetical protein